MEDFHTRYITGVRHYLADKGATNGQKEADVMQMEYQTYRKIMTGVKTPTLAQCVQLCEVAEYSANWLLLGIGEMGLQHQAKLNEILAAVKKRQYASNS